MKLDVKNKPTKSNFLKATPIKVVTEIPETLEGVKAVQKEAIANLTVTTTSGKVFDATLEARQNMADAILASATLGLIETIWRLADNTEVLVTLDELREAHALALRAYAKEKGIQ